MLLVVFTSEVMVKEKVQHLTLANVHFLLLAINLLMRQKQYKLFFLLKEKKNTVCMSGFIKRPLILVLDELSKTLTWICVLSSV